MFNLFAHRGQASFKTVLFKLAHSVYWHFRWLWFFGQGVADALSSSACHNNWLLFKVAEPRPLWYTGLVVLGAQALDRVAVCQVVLVGGCFFWSRA